MGGFVARDLGRGRTRSSPRPTPTPPRSYGPDRVFGFSPIPAMSMVSYAAGSRYLSLIGGVCMSLLRLVLRPAAGLARRPGASRPTCRNRPTGTTRLSSCCGARTCRRPARPTRTSITEVRYKGAKIVVDHARLLRSRRSSPTSGCIPKQGTDAALAMAMGHVILKEFHLDRQVDVFPGLLPPLHRHADAGAAGRSRTGATCRTASCAPSDFAGRPGRGQQPRLEDGRLRRDHRRARRAATARSASAGARQRQVEPRGAARRGGADVKLRLSLIDAPRRGRRRSRFPYFGGIEHEHFRDNDQGRDVLRAQRPGEEASQLADGEALVATVFDLLVRQLRRRPRPWRRQRRQDLRRRRPLHAGLGREDHRRAAPSRSITVAREFADNAEKTNGKSMVIIGAGDEPLVPHRT